MRCAGRVARELDDSTDPEVEALYRLPLGEFTRGRNALAARRKRAGQIEQAAAVARLVKPSPPVWAINQAVHDDPAGAARFLEAVERLRATQSSQPAAVAQATARQRAELERLMELAGRALTGAGFRDMTARMLKTLLGGAVNRPADFRAGRLTDELALPGFEALTGEPPPRPDEVVAPRHPPRREESAPERQHRERQERMREALRVAEAEAEDARERADRLDQATAEHQRTLAETEALLDTMRGQVKVAEERVADARRAVAQAERQAEQAHREAERARAKRVAPEKALKSRH